MLALVTGVRPPSGSLSVWSPPAAQDAETFTLGNGGSTPLGLLKATAKELEHESENYRDNDRYQPHGKTLRLYATRARKAAEDAEEKLVEVANGL